MSMSVGQNPQYASYAYSAQQPPVARPVSQPTAAIKRQEAFKGETEILKAIYDEYMKNAGGFKEVNGQRVHVTTALHTDTSAINTVIAVANRLKELGALPNAA